MFRLPFQPRRPGLFLTATDTGVGKTVIACAVAASLRRAGLRVGVCKPFATGCRREREGLVSEDAEALAHFSNCRQGLEVINPVRYQLAVAPAVAAEHSGRPVDFEAVGRALAILDDANDAVLVEGVGGLMAPLDDARPSYTVLDFAAALGYPVVIVCRAGLGTLSHTAMTATLLRQRGLKVAGLVINGYEADTSARERSYDVSMTSNRIWLTKMTGLPVLAVAPACPSDTVAAHRGRIPAAVLDAVHLCYWPEVLSVPFPER